MSDLFDENKEIQQIDEVTSKTQSIQTELLEAKKTKILLKQKLDEHEIAYKKFQESSNKKITQIKDQNEKEKLLKQLQTMQEKIDVQRAEAFQLIQAVDGKQYRKIEQSACTSNPCQSLELPILRKILHFQYQTWKHTKPFVNQLRLNRLQLR